MIVRCIVLSATIAVLAAMWMTPTPPHKEAVIVPYCVIDMRIAAKDPFGRWHKGYAEGYGPCSQQDRYVNA